MNSRDLQNSLSTPFHPKDIEFRIGRVSAKNRKANVLAYITARAIMERLDSVFGIEGWKDEYEVLQNGVKCRLSVKVGDAWICKEDVAPFTNIEALKGAFSDSLKRAGVKFGIGRYLYDLPDYWVEIMPEKPQSSGSNAHYYSSEGMTGYWMDPHLPDWALPDQKSMISPEFVEKMDALFQRQLLTTAKYEQFKQALASPKTNAAQRKLIAEQLDLIGVWGDSIPTNSNLSQEEKRALYLKILNCSSRTIESLKAEISGYSSLEEAA